MYISKFFEQKRGEFAVNQRMSKILKGHAKKPVKTPMPQHLLMMYLKRLEVR